jgi:aarF domain-containing kinase
MRLRHMLEERQVNGVLVPAIFEEFSTRRLLVSEWVDGTKLTELPAEELRELVSVGQEAFLVQLLQVFDLYRFLLYFLNRL